MYSQLKWTQTGEKIVKTLPQFSQESYHLTLVVVKKLKPSACLSSRKFKLCHIPLNLSSKRVDCWLVVSFILPYLLLAVSSQWVFSFLRNLSSNNAILHFLFVEKVFFYSRILFSFSFDDWVWDVSMANILKASIPCQTTV